MPKRLEQSMIMLLFFKSSSYICSGNKHNGAMLKVGTQNVRPDNLRSSIILTMFLKDELLALHILMCIAVPSILGRLHQVNLVALA